MNLEALPTFACAKDKRPLAGSHGWKDARPHTLREMWAWPRIGVATGAISGIDVLDVDPEGLAWFAEVPLPATRHQFTQRGVHLYFAHQPGLRLSSGKIAGTDIRADGGHVIWWEREGFDCLWPDLLAPWPEWLLRLMAPQGSLRSPGRVASRGDGRVVAPLSRSPQSVPTSRVRNPAAVLRWHADRLAGLAPGGRSAALLSAAVAMGAPVRAGRIPVEQVRATLLRAADRAGLIADYGEGKVEKTIENGLAWRGRASEDDQRAHAERSEALRGGPKGERDGR